MYTFTSEVKDTLGFLFNEKGFKVVENFGSYNEPIGDAYILISNGHLDIQLTRDRDQKLWDIKSSSMKKNEWSSIGILRHIFLADKLFRDFLNHNNAHFFKEYYSKIEEFFNKNNLSESRKLIENAKQKRVNFLFG